MNKKDTVFIELTEDQLSKLDKLVEKVRQATLENKPIILLAQINIIESHFGDRAVLVANVATHEQSLQLQEMFVPELRGKVTDTNYKLSALLLANK